MNMLPDTNQSRLGRRLIKRFLYSQMALMDAVKILFGKAQPRVPFTVKAQPASVYFNFIVKDKDQFCRYLNLPPGFDLCPMRCLEDEATGDYLLTLNVYEVSGIAVGIRAEWSTYIRDQSGCPRYMVVEAQSSEYSMDPIDIITKKGRVEHNTDGGETVTTVASLQQQLFQARYSYNQDCAVAGIHAEWVTANDYIYWRNGVCDRTFYDTGLAFPRARLIDPQSARIEDQTHWAKFLHPIPKHIIQYEQAIDFVIVPWSNIDD